MRNAFNRMLIMSAATALFTGTIAIAQEAGAAAAAQAPKAREERDVIVVRPEVPGMFVSGDRMAARVGEGKLVKTAFLGVGVSAAPSVLSEQLKLPQGVGLVIEFVEKGSPADKAGVLAKDVLHKMDEQLLVNPQQLATLVRTYKPSDSVKLTVIRKGEPVTLSATLVEKELPELGANMTQQFEFSTLPGASAQALAPGFAAEMKALAERDAANAIKGRVIRIMPGSTSKIIKVDDSGLRIELETREGMKSVKILDKDGKTIFSGPYTTEQDIEKVPAEYRDRVKAVEEGIELKEVPATSPTEPKAEAKPLYSTGPKA